MSYFNFSLDKEFFNEKIYIEDYIKVRKDKYLLVLFAAVPGLRSLNQIKNIYTYKD